MNLTNVLKSSIYIIGLVVGLMLAKTSYDMDRTSLTVNDKRNINIVGSLGVIISSLVIIRWLYNIVYKKTEENDHMLLIMALCVLISSSILIDSILSGDIKSDISRRCLWGGFTQVLISAVYIGNSFKKSK